MPESKEPSSRAGQSAPGLDRSLLVWLLVAGVMLVGLWLADSSDETRSSISYAAFKRHLADGEVSHVEVAESEIRGELGASSTGDAGGTSFRTVRVDDPELIAQLEKAGVEYEGVRSSRGFEVLLGWLVPLALLAALWIFMLRRFGGGGASQAAMGFGRSPAKLAAEEEIEVRFADVAGCEEAKTELAEVVEFLKHPEHFKRLGAAIPKGVLLTGPPGTGKTLLARAVAGEARVPFYSLSGSDFVEMFVGVGAARVRDLFRTSRSNTPPASSSSTNSTPSGARAESTCRRSTTNGSTRLNQLLVEMDGFERNSGVIILSATNRPDVLDPALTAARTLRSPGGAGCSGSRLGRRAILEVHSPQEAPLAPDVDLDAVARATPGFSGADLANVMNEAALLAARRGADTVSNEDLEAAVDKVVAGPERKSRRLEEPERRRVAYHETGHALVAIHSEAADPVHKISIVPRGRAALGYTLQLPTGDHHLLTRTDLDDRIKGLLGGRAAEEIVFGDVSTGAENDLEQATTLARRIVAQFGMGESAGLMHCARNEGALQLLDPLASLQRDCSEKTASAIDDEVKSLLDDAYAGARETLTKYRDELEQVAEELLAEETLDREAIDRLIEGRP